jgi:hypothetical protein
LDAPDLFLQTRDFPLAFPDALAGRAERLLYCHAPVLLEIKLPQHGEQLADLALFRAHGVFQLRHLRQIGNCLGGLLPG